MTTPRPITEADLDRLEELLDSDAFGAEGMLLDEIQALLKDICLTIDMRDYVDIREPVRNYIRVKLPAEAREAANRPVARLGTAA